MLSFKIFQDYETAILINLHPLKNSYLKPIDIIAYGKETKRVCF